MRIEFLCQGLTFRGLTYVYNMPQGVLSSFISSSPALIMILALFGTPYCICYHVPTMPLDVYQIGTIAIL